MNLNHTFFKTAFIFVLSVFFANSTFAQIVHSKGYIVDNNNKRINCLIKNDDWRNNPSKIQYRLTEDTESKIATLDSLKEFGIDDYSRYVRTRVKIDRSPADIRTLTENKKPEWSEELLFLRELVCGKAGLWSYTDSERTWYFFNIDNAFPEQLVYKEWVKDDFLGENMFFRQQLLNYVHNEHTEKINIEKLKYTEKELVAYFKLFNATQEYCSRTDFNHPKREVLDVKLVASLNYCAMNFDLQVYASDFFNYGHKMNPSLGAELEYFLPFYNNKWSVVFEPTFEHYSLSKDYTNLKSYLKCYSVSLPIGVRYNFKLNNDLKLHFSTSLNSFFSSKLKSATFNQNYVVDSSSANDIILGLGVDYHNLGMSFKYHSSREFLGEYIIGNLSNPKFSLSFNYKLVSLKGK